MKRTNVYNRPKKDSKRLGADKVMSILQSDRGSALGRTAVRNILMKIKIGKNLVDIDQEKSKGRGGAGGSNQHPDKPNVI